MDQQAVDRRTKKTHKAIIKAFLTLLTEKSYEQISVQDITEAADVGRSTFYVHFENKDDLLVKGFGTVLDHLVSHLEFKEEEQRLFFDVTTLFAHAAGHYTLYRDLIWGRGFPVLSEGGYQSLREKIEKLIKQNLPDSDTVPVDLLAATLSGGLLIMLKWWLDQKMPYSPAEMNAYFQTTLMRGVQETFGG